MSSDHLALEEVEVWRAVLNWARHQVGLYLFFCQNQFSSIAIDKLGQCLAIQKLSNVE